MGSSSKSKWRSFDVFISFRGEDTRSNFTSHLIMGLRQKGVNVFIDDKLHGGEEISVSLLKSIEESMISIIVFSENYANSSWCLDELVKIIECMESNNQVVFPVFYKVDPSNVRKQTGSFGEALAKYDQVKFMLKIQKWRKALTAAANLSGWDLGTWKEADLIQNLVEEVLSKLNRTPLYVAKHIVGIDSQLQIIELPSHVMSDGVNMVGIYGIGGIGKTTLAKALYNKVAGQFEAIGFLSNVREASRQFGGLVQLQEKLLYEISKDEMKVGNLDRGINIIRSRLCSKKVLILLDDVDKREQLDALVGGRDWFGRGSKIIVTTRDKHLLSSYGFDKLHGIQELDDDKALELFSWYAFKRSHPPNDYSDLSQHAVDYCKGLPLALVVLGSFLCSRDQSKWKSVLDQFENSLNKDIQDILQISYDGLEDNVKDIFLDIACFFVGEHVDNVKNMLEACNLNPDFGITVLRDLSLITIIYAKVQMHDLIKQMGREIVHGESSEPGNRSRLWMEEEIMDVLIENLGTNAVKAIKLDLPKPTEFVNIDAQAFRNMKNLRLLIVRNATFSTNFEYLPNKLKWIDWPGFSFSSLPPRYSPKQLVGLNLQGSFIKHLGKGFKNCERLKHLDFRNCKLLKEIPDLSTAPNLERLQLSKCTNLRMIHESLGSLGKIVTLKLAGCSNLEKLPNNLMSNSLRVLDLSLCTKLEEIPSFSTTSNLAKLVLCGCKNLRLIHESVGSLSKLAILDLEFCSNFEKLPSNLMLTSLTHLNLKHCKKLQQFPRNVQSMKSLTWLSLSSTTTKELPSTIGYLTSLVSLSLSDCTDLVALPSTVHLLKNLWSLDLRGCCKLDMSSIKWEPTCSAPAWVSPTLRFPRGRLPLKKSSIPHLPLKESSYPDLSSLDLSDCNLSNVDFLETLCNVFTSLSDLSLSRNKFQSLPPCLHKFTTLRTLRLCDCEFLQEIPNLPKSITLMDASGSKSDARLPENIVDIMSRVQAMERNKLIDLILMKSEIPEWLSHRSMTRTNSVTISLQHDPRIGITLISCVVFKVNCDSKTTVISCPIRINNKTVNSRRRIIRPSTSEYMRLQSFHLKPLDFLNDCNQDHLTVSFDVTGFSNTPVTVIGYGVHLIEKLNAEEIQMAIARAT